MAYKTLYRKWRPTTFDEVIGQSHITETLKNEIKTQKLSHAYIFTGTRGTGKTSTAKILSRAVNCQNTVDGNPCNTCAACLGIINGTSLDVSEIDAASNTGVDNIREIIDQVRYTTATNKYKVYIIDEVHMLSDGAFNALLKTLEEPPEHTIFILATTEIHKVFPTILSRCQRFDFKNITSIDISNALDDILKKENINAEPDAVDYVAQLGNGSMRDALSILEQCLAYKNNDLLYSDVTQILGTLDDSLLYGVAESISKGDIKSVLMMFGNCINSGKSPESFSLGLLGVMRDLIVYTCAPESDRFTDMKKKNLQKSLGFFTVEKLVRYIEILTELNRDINKSSSSRVLVESALIRLTCPQMSFDLASVLDRLSALENNLKNGTFAASNNNVETIEEANEKPVVNHQPESVEISNLAMQNSKKVEAKIDGDFANIISMWENIKSELNERGYLVAFVNLYNTSLVEDNNRIIIEFHDKDAMHNINNEENILAIRQIISDLFGKNVDIECVLKEELSKTDTQNDDIFNDIAKLSNSFPENFKLD